MSGTSAPKDQTKQAQQQGKPSQPNPQTDTTSAEDKTKPADPDARNSVGGDNPGQPAAAPVQTTGAGEPADGADAQGHASREAEQADRNGEPRAAATVGNTVTPTSPGRLPSEGAGYTPAPDEATGEADSDKVGFTQAAQRLVHPDHEHGLAKALGEPANIPPGSRPMMIDPQTGLGVKPPQTERRDAKAPDDSAAEPAPPVG